MNNTNKIKCGVLGATGMVGKKFLELLSYHEWIEVVVVAASERSAGEKMKFKIPPKDQTMICRNILELTIQDASDVANISKQVDFVFCALDMDNCEIIKLEELYAQNEVVVVSNNSAMRGIDDVPMIVPEINGIEHLKVLQFQRKRLGTEYGCVVVKPNCAAQSFMTLIDVFNKNDIMFDNISVSLMQAISGSGKYLKDVPEIQGNILALPSEAEKSIREPLKIFGTIKQNKIVNNEYLAIFASSYRVPVENGHTANIFIRVDPDYFSKINFIEALRNYNPLSNYDLPLSPKNPIVYLGDNIYPNPLEHVDMQKGMQFTYGGIIYDDINGIFQITGLIHNLIRGAAGGAVLTAELMIKLGYIKNMR